MEIENAVMEIGGIEACKAIGIPSEHYGEEICLCVVLKKSSGVNEDTIRTALSGKLASYKQPKYVLFFRNLPFKATGKIDLAQLKKDSFERLGVSAGASGI